MLILSDVAESPFQKNNFSHTEATTLWDGVGYSVPIDYKRLLRNVRLRIIANGFESTYTLREMSRRILVDDFDDQFETNCVVLQFEIQR
jgi:hypothetical protein